MKQITKCARCGATKPGLTWWSTETSHILPQWRALRMICADCRREIDAERDADIARAVRCMRELARMGPTSKRWPSRYPIKPLTDARDVL